MYLFLFVVDDKHLNFNDSWLANIYNIITQQNLIKIFVFVLEHMC